MLIITTKFRVVFDFNDGKQNKNIWETISNKMSITNSYKRQLY